MVHRPETLEEVRAIVAAARSVRVLGTRHSFNDIGAAEELVSLAALPADVDVDVGTVTCGAGMTYGELALELDRHGLALANLASLPHISVGGAVATGTHGSGDALGSLATAVAGLELVTSGGDVVHARRGDPGFDGMVVSLGALGAVTRLTLDVEPAYPVTQRVYEGLAWDALDAHFDAIFAAGDSVSVFTTLGDAVDQVWVKRRAPEARADLFGARPATVERHPILGLDPVHCTAQLGRPGPWWDRLPHFRHGFRPSAGEELQSEFLLPREQAIRAVHAVREQAAALHPVLRVCEIRTVAADRLWMSPAYERASAGIHFTWRLDPAGVDTTLAAVEPALLELGARPHWGKRFRAGADVIAPRYARLPDFLALAERLDPRGAFANDWFRERLLSRSARGSRSG